MLSSDHETGGAGGGGPFRIKNAVRAISTSAVMITRTMKDHGILASRRPACSRHRDGSLASLPSQHALRAAFGLWCYSVRLGRRVSGFNAEVTLFDFGHARRRAAADCSTRSQAGMWFLPSPSPSERIVQCLHLRDVVVMPLPHDHASIQEELRYQEAP